MGTVKVNFSSLESAIKDTATTAANVRAYGDALKNDNFSILNNLPGGQNYNTESAYVKIKEKNEELTKTTEGMADRLDNLSKKLKTFQENVKIADGNIKSFIEREATTTQKAMGVSSSVIENFWFSICDGVHSLLNQTEFGQMISSWVRQFDDWLTSCWEEFQIWYKFEGGEFLINIAVAVLTIVVSVFTILTAGAGFLAVVAVIGAICGIINALGKFGSNIEGYISFKNGDPAWAHRLKDNGDLKSWGEDHIKGGRGNGFYEFAQDLGKVVNVVDTVCAVIQFVDFSTKLAEKFTKKETLFQKYFGSKGYFDHAMHSLDTKKAFFDKDLRKWVKLDDAGNKTKEIIDFRNKSEFLRRAKLKTNPFAFSKSAVELKRDVKAGIATNVLTLELTKCLGPKDGLKSFLSIGADAAKTGLKTYFKDDLSVKNIAKVLGKDIHNNMGFKKFSTDATNVQDALKYYSGRQGMTNLLKGVAVLNNIDSGLKVTTNFSHLGTGNFDDLSPTNKQLARLKKRFGGFGLQIGHTDNWYDNWNAILH